MTSNEHVQCEATQRKRRFPAISKAARALGVTRQHLWCVLSGRRSNPALIDAYHSIRSNPTHLKKLEQMTHFQTMQELEKTLENMTKDCASISASLDLIAARQNEVTQRTREVIALGRELLAATNMAIDQELTLAEASQAAAVSRNNSQGR